MTIISITVADFDRDGLADIAVGMIGGDGLVLFTNRGTGRYEVTTRDRSLRHQLNCR